MNAWDYIAASLAASGVKAVFGLPGDGCDLFTALVSHPEVRSIMVRDQRNAGFMAWGYSQVTGQNGVCAVSAGPGFTNILTALLEVSSAAAPLVVLVASTPLTWRQRGGFQATDHLALSAPLTRWSFQVSCAEQLPWALQRAFHMASNGLPGPVVLEIPDGLEAPSAPAINTLLQPAMRCQADPSAIERVVAACQSAQRPVLLIGGGARRAAAGKEIEHIADLLSAPLFVTASGRTTIDENHPRLLGLVGLYLLPEAADILVKADLILVWGSRLEESATLGWSLPVPGTTLIQVDICADSIGTAYPDAIGLLGDCLLVAQQLRSALAEFPQPDRSRWHAEVQAAAYDLQARAKALVRTENSAISAAAVVPAIVEVFGPELVLAQENGLLDIWGFHYPLVKLPPESLVIVPAEQTAMGCGAAAALGAAAAQQPVACVTGDGAFHFVLAELATAVAERLGVTYVVLDNGGYGWVRYRQSQLGVKDIACTFTDGADIVRRASGVGIQASTVATYDELIHALKQARMLNQDGLPAVIHIPTRWQEIPPGVIAAYGEPGATGGER